MNQTLSIAEDYSLRALYFILGGRNTAAITRKELGSYLGSPVAYVVAAIFLALTGVFFVSSISGAFPEATVRGFLEPSTFFVIPVIAPLLTMRLLAEEQKMGTMELLLTAPVRDYQVVLGKFLASFVILSGTVALTAFYVLLLSWFGDPDGGPVLSGYLGFILYIAAALAVGILASSLSSNQIVSAVLGFGILLIMILLDQASDLVQGFASTLLEEASLLTHFEEFSRGIIDLWNVTYYITVIGVFLFLTVLALESRRWR